MNTTNHLFNLINKDMSPLKLKVACQLNKLGLLQFRIIRVLFGIDLEKTTQKVIELMKSQSFNQQVATKENFTHLLAKSWKIKNSDLYLNKIHVALPISIYRDLGLGCVGNIPEMIPHFDDLTLENREPIPFSPEELLIPLHVRLETNHLFPQIFYLPKNLLKDKEDESLLGLRFKDKHFNLILRSNKPHDKYPQGSFRSILNRLDELNKNTLQCQTPTFGNMDPYFHLTLPNTTVFILDDSAKSLYLRPTFMISFDDLPKPTFLETEKILDEGDFFLTCRVPDLKVNQADCYKKMVFTLNPQVFGIAIIQEKMSLLEFQKKRFNLNAEQIPDLFQKHASEIVEAKVQTRQIPLNTLFNDLNFEQVQEIMKNYLDVNYMNGEIQLHFKLASYRLTLSQ